MKKTLLITGVLLAFSAAIAAAQPGLNLSWDDCLASGGPSAGLNKTSTCLSNFEVLKVMQGSYVLGPGTVAVNGNEIVLDVQAAADPLPCWWNMIVGQPRAAGWDMIFVTPVNCADYWGGIPGGPSGGSGASVGLASNRIRFKGVVAIDFNAAQPLPEGVEFYSFTFRLRFGSTVGVTCPGCLTPACFVLNQIRVTQSNAPSIDITNPSSRRNVTWQSPLACEGVTSTQSRTWGSIKGLYR